MPGEVKIKVGADTADAEAGAKRIERSYKSALDNTTRSVHDLRGAFAALGGFAVVAALKQVGEAALKSAIDLDKMRQTTAALTGSVEAANKKIAELRKLAADPIRGVGVTASFAVDLFNQLKALNQIAEPTINKIITAVGKLNAVFSIESPQRFARNLTQIFQKSFDQIDIREALGQVPIFNQILQQAFGTSDPDKLRALKNAGKLSLAAYLEGIAEAIEKDPRFASIQESLGGKLAKAKDNILLALAPLGDELGKILLPLLKDVEEAAKKFGTEAAKAFRESKTEIIEAAHNIGDFITSLGHIGSALGGIDRLKKELRDLSVIAADLADIFSGDVSVKDFFLLRPGPRGQALQNRFAVEDADVAALRGSPFLSSAPVVKDQPAVTGLKGGDKGTKAAKDAESKARAIREAQLAFTKSQAENEFKVVQDINNRGLKDLEDLYDQSKITVKDYYEFRKNLAVDTLDAELRKLDEEAKALTENLTKAKGAERIRDETKLNDVLAEQALKRKEILDTIIQSGREFKKATALPGSIEAEEVKAVDLREKDRLRRLNEARQQLVQFQAQDLELRRQQVEIQNAVAAGVFTEAEGREAILELQRQSRDVQIEFLKAQERREIDPVKIGEIRLQIEQLKNLGLELDPATAFFKGLSNETQTLAEKLESLGQQLRRTFVDLFQDLLEKGSKAFFSGLLSVLRSTLARMTAELLASAVFRIFQPGGGFGGFGGGAAAASGGGGIGGTIGNIFGGLLGGGGGGGFLTPGFNPNASRLNFVEGALTSAFGAPTARGTGFGSILPSAGGGLSKLLGGLGLGKGGILGSLGLAGPLLGASLGSGLGGQSTLGRIAGAIGGGAVGLGVAFGASIFGAGGGLASAALAFAGPAALIGVPLLVGAILLGRASQRRKDEAASGDFLTQALNAIQDLKRGISTDQIDGRNAPSIFENQILATFIQQINQLKTKSVRESRLTNQVRDLRAVFNAEIPPEIELQRRRKLVNAKLIPEFAVGGIVPGFDRGFDNVTALLRPGEMVLTRAQQGAIAAMAGAGVFQAAGVPAAGINTPGGEAFALGGRVTGGDFVIRIDSIELNITEEEAERIVARGARTDGGRRVVISAVRQAQKFNLI